MGLKCGFVGLPNVGKSTLFNALTRSNIAAENYPFCTIEPNTGVVELPDNRLQKISDLLNPKKTISAIVEFTDIAGLVAGASKGEGLGNKFLANIRESSAIINVVRCFEDENVVHVNGRVDPLSDVETITTELALSDLNTLEKRSVKLEKMQKSGDKKAKFEYELVNKCIEPLNNRGSLNEVTFEKQEEIVLASFNLLTLKPMMFVANVSENGFSDNKHLSELKSFASAMNIPVVTICASLESQLVDFEENEKKEFLQASGMEEPGLNRLIREAFYLLGLQTFFTAGPNEVRAWTIKKDSTAPVAAGEIHSDFERGFIRADVISYSDFIIHGSDAAAREAGKLRSEGKEYVVSDGDVIHFKFNV